MLAVFDFPDKADPAVSDVEVPELIVTDVIGRPA
jgi:hypothetical protein